MTCCRLTPKSKRGKMSIKFEYCLDVGGREEFPPVQPRAESAGSDPGIWVRSVQVWVCLGILHHRTDEPWSTSRRRRLLVRLVFGIEDWGTEAALFALVTAAWGNPAVRQDVAAIVRQRLAGARLPR